MEWMHNIYYFIRYLLCVNHCASTEDKNIKALGTKISYSAHLTYAGENRIQNHLYVIFMNF